MNLQKPLPHPRALAHLGDAVYELWVREEAIQIHAQNVDLHDYSSRRVKAETQCKLLEKLLPHLNEEETSIVKRGQNIPVPAGRRSNQSVYRKATAFEALIGFWHYLDEPRLAQFRSMIMEGLKEIFEPESGL